MKVDSVFGFLVYEHRADILENTSEDVDDLTCSARRTKVVGEPWMSEYSECNTLIG